MRDRDAVRMIEAILGPVTVLEVLSENKPRKRVKIRQDEALWSEEDERDWSVWDSPSRPSA